MLSETNSSCKTSTDIESWLTKTTATTNNTGGIGDDVWRICTKQSATLPRSFHSSTILRRRYMGSDAYSVAMDDGEAFALIGAGADMGADEFPYSPTSGAIYRDQGFSYSASGLLLGAGRPSNTLMATSASSATAVAAAAAAASAAALLVSQGIRMSMPADMGESLSDFHPFSISASLPCVKSGSGGNVGAFGGGLAMGCNNGSGSQMVAASASASGGVVASAAGLPFLQVGQNHYHQPQQQQQQQQHLQLQIRQQDIARSAAAAAAAVATDSTVSGGGAGIFSTFGEGNMLHALLSRLPEPPVSRPNNNSNSNINNDSSSNINYLNSSVASLTALADSLPVPPHTRTDEEDEEEGRGDGRPLSPPPSSPSLSLSSSMDSVDSATPTIDTLRQTTLINGPEPPLLLLDTRAQAKEPLASTAVGQNRKQQQQKQKQQRFSAVMAADQEAGAVAGNAEQTGRAQSRRPSTGLSGLLGKNLASLDVSGMIVAPETPASSRRNTDEVSLTKQHRDQLQTIEPGEPLGRNSSSGSSAGATRAAASPGPTLLDAEMLSSEMPPPFIMEEDNGTAGRAQIEQMSLTGRQRATWCGVSAQTLELTPSGARTRSRTRTSIVDGVPEPEMPLADRPDGSDKQQREQLPAIPAVEESDGHMYRLDIRGLFESPLSKRCGKCRRQRPHAVLRAMDGKSQPDAKEANSVMRGGAGLELRDGQRRLLHVSRAMRRALLLGPTAAADGTMGGNKTPLMDEGKATGMRQPSCHCEAGTTSSGAQDNQDSSSSSRKRWTDLLAVSVVASANPPPLSSADKRAACVDIEAMVALHLPRVFSRFRRIVGDDARCDEGDSQQQQQQPQQPKAPAPSAGSNSGSRLPLASMRLAGRRSDAGIVPATRIPLGAAIAADGSGIRRPWNGMRQRLSTPPSLDIQRSLRMSSGSGIGSSISSAGCDTTTYLHTAQLHAARSSSLRRTTTPSSSALPSPATPRSLVPRPSVSRRRSEVQALISQANAVLGNSNSNSSSNGFGTAPPAASRLRPPRSSLPLSFAENIHARAPNGSSSSRFSGNYYSQSLRYSLATPRTSVLSLSPRNSQRLSSLSESEATTPLRASPPAALSAALSRQHHRLESARGESASPGGDVSPLALTPVRSLNSDVFASVRTARGMRASVSFSAGSAAAAGSSASASASALGSTRIPIIRNASASQIHASMPAIRRLPSSGRLRPVGADHDDSISSSSSLPSLARRVTVNQGRRVAAAAAAAAASAAFSSGASDSDSEFLTLRPVHTPDLVPRTIDPRLIERAMTPMLKRNIKAQQQQHLSQQPRSLAHALVGSLVESMESMESGAKPTHALLPSPPPHSPSPPPPPHPQSQSPPQQTLPLSPRLSQSLSPRQSLLARDSTSTTTQDASGGVSRMSPLNSPDISADAPRRRSFGAGRFAMPTGLFSRSKKNSSKPVSAVSAIPMPPPPSSASASASATATASASAKVRSSNLGISNIPSLSKARSLWSLKAGSAIASSLYFSKK